MVYTIRRPVIERLMEKVTKRPDGCWEWLGATCGAKGYGIMSVRPDGPHASRLVHRISYEIHVGEIGPNLTIDHLCMNRKCVNPDHLEPVTAAENTRRRSAVRTHCKRGHELTPENVMLCTDGARRCRLCHNASTNAWGKRQRGMRNGNAHTAR